LITDLHMPLMSGAELIGKARQAAPHLHIILCTGDVRDTTEAEARSLGADRVLHKPVEIQSVAKAMLPQFTNLTQTSDNAEQT
jgi:CheY-like chemotaxis protein